jgi:alpha-L-fucosidase
MMAQPTTPEQRLAEWAQMHATKADALTAFNEAKFGMFIHWGLYAIPGGVWKGQRMEEDGVGPTVAEWIMRRRSIPRAEYAELAAGFNPVKFDADEWAEIAAAAGMKYMVITSKHHDGFALYDSKVSDFNIVDASPFQRDVIEELHDACADHGVRFGVYYSHTLDWHDGGDFGLQYTAEPTGLRKIGSNDWDPSPRTFDDYLRDKSLPQVEELAERYPDLFLVWFDGAGYIPEEKSLDFYRAIYRHAPQTLVQSRLSNDVLPRDLGDYQSAGDNHVPDPEELGKAYWETCGTMNNSWGYRSYDHDWKCPLEVLSWLVDVVSRGGNYLLNVGPDGEGSIPAESVRILREVGKWLGINGDAIYGTRAWTVSREGPTALTRKGTGQREKLGFQATFTSQDFWFTRKDRDVYAIALAYPEDQRALVCSMRDVAVVGVRMLGSDASVPWEKTPEGLRVQLPAQVSSHGYALGVELGE